MSDIQQLVSRYSLDGNKTKTGLRERVKDITLHSLDHPLIRVKYPLNISPVRGSLSSQVLRGSLSAPGTHHLAPGTLRAAQGAKSGEKSDRKRNGQVSRFPQRTLTPEYNS